MRSSEGERLRRPIRSGWFVVGFESFQDLTKGKVPARSAATDACADPRYYDYIIRYGT
jgi:hypothetical protein